MPMMRFVLYAQLALSGPWKQEYRKTLCINLISVNKICISPYKINFHFFDNKNNG